MFILLSDFPRIKSKYIFWATDTKINKNNSVVYIDRLKGEDSGMIMIVIIVAIKVKDEIFANELNRTPITKKWDW